MNKNILVGIPVFNLENPMTRLSSVLNSSQRIDLQIGLLKNTINSFKKESVEIYVISKDTKIELICTELGIQMYKSNLNGLNNEVVEFSGMFSQYKHWIICHADLPYINKHQCNVLFENLKSEDLLISKSSDSGTPLISGSVKFSDFSYGVESFESHIKNLKRLKINYKQIFSRELTFEIDTPDDYKNFLLHKPRWYRKLS